MDVVYLCRSGRNEELRYSLRSLINLPHDDVWIVGGCPQWVRGVRILPVGGMPSKYDATTANLIAACAAGVSERFVLMNDDFFVMRPISEVPTLHRGPISDIARSHRAGGYAAQMLALAAWLRERGYPELCYEVHAPMVLERARVAEVLDLPAPRRARVIHKRSLYGNVVGVGGERVRDPKVHGEAWDATATFLSTNDASFERAVGRHIRASFAEPCAYETEAR